MTEDIVAVLPKGHKLANQSSCNLQQLMSEPWLTGRRKIVSRMYEEVQSACDAIGMMPQGRRIAVRMATLVCLVAGGFGIALLPVSAARPGVEGAVFRELEGRPIKVPLSLVTRHGHAPAALARHMDLIARPAQRTTVAQKRETLMHRPSRPH